MTKNKGTQSLEKSLTVSAYDFISDEVGRLLRRVTLAVDTNCLPSGINGSIFQICTSHTYMS